MKRFVLLSLFAIITLAHTKMVDGVAVIVEGEVVTTAEIRAVSSQMGVSKKEARELLIQDRLQKAAMKNVSIADRDIDAKIVMIAQKNNLSVKKMQKVLKSQGTRWSKFRLSVKESMKKEKFFQKHIVTTIPNPSQTELKNYYKKHKKEFTMPSKVRLVEYSSKSQKKMDKFLKDKKSKGLSRRTITKSTKKLNPTLLATILSTPNGSFTKSFNAGDKYICYKVLSKTGKRNSSFEVSKGAIISKWKQNQQTKALKDYFAKHKTNANIQIIR